MKTLTAAAAIAATLLLGGQQRTIGEIVGDLKKLVAELDPYASTTITVAPGASVQKAIEAAKAGDTIVLQAGATYVGALSLGAKTGVVTIRSSATLPNRRLTPADAPLLPLISSGNLGPALTGSGAANWRLEGLAFQSTPTGAGEILAFENAQAIALDRLLIVAGPDGQKRAIRGNGRQVSLTRSYIANIIRAGQDSQAFAAWEGAGPYLLDDNYLEASGENVLFGGSDNLGGASTNPADIVITRNYLFKPEAWRNQPGTVKNLLELKNATRVVIRDNLLEGEWTDAQSGFAVLLKPVNQDGRAPWTALRDVLVERNYLKNVERGFNMLGYDYNHVSTQASGIVIRKNVIEAKGHCLQFASEFTDFTFDDNVCDNGFNIATLYKGSVREVEGQPTRPALWSAFLFNFNRNVARHNEYGIIGGGMGTKALVENIQTWTFVDNKIVGRKVAYPPTTVDITEADLTAAKAALLKELGR